MNRPSIDEARLLPRYRHQPVTIIQPDNGILHMPTFNGRPGTPKPSSTIAQGEPGDLRGIPVVGARGVGGVSPGTQPERSVVSRHGDWTRAA